MGDEFEHCSLCESKIHTSREAFRLTALCLLTVAQQLVILTRFPSFDPPQAENLEVRAAKVGNYWRIKRDK